MDGHKKDDFWNTSDDSFWKESVVDTDWLKSDTSDTWNTDRDLQEEKIVKEQLVNQATQENPYASSSWLYNYEESKMPDDTTGYQTSAQVYEQITGQAEEKKKKSRAHLIIRLVFVGLAVISVIASVVGYFMTKKAAIRSLEDVSFETVEADGSFQFYENDTVTIGDEAYTVVSEQSFQGFPENQKLIAIYVDVKSDIYIRGRYMIREPYVGYEYNDSTLYKVASYAEDIALYLEESKLQKKDILSIYGVGNGIDNAGYYVFMVPEDVENVTLYIEQNAEENGVEVTKKIYQKEIKVLPESEMLTAVSAGKETE